MLKFFSEFGIFSYVMDEAISQRQDTRLSTGDLLDRCELVMTSDVFYCLYTFIVAYLLLRR